MMTNIFHKDRILNYKQKLPIIIKKVLKINKEYLQHFRNKSALLHGETRINDDKRLVLELEHIFKTEKEVIHKEIIKIEKAIKEISIIIKDEQQSRYKGINYSYQEYKDLVALHTILLEQIKQIKSQNKLILESKDIFDHNTRAKFEQLISVEAKILGEENIFLEKTQKDQELEEISDHKIIDESKLTKLIIGYGSLLNPESLFKTLQTTSKHIKAEFENDPQATLKKRVVPVLVYGFKRIFNVICSTKFYQTETHIKHKMLAALGLEVNPKSYFNALAIRVTEEEYLAVAKREDVYKYVPARCTNLLTGEILKGGMISYPKASTKEFDPKEPNAFFKNRQITYNQLCPLRYYLLCTVGVRKLDEYLGLHIMEHLFKKTTYILDLEIDYSLLNKLKSNPIELRKKTRSIYRSSGFLSMYEFEKRGHRVHYGGEPIPLELYKDKYFKKVVGKLYKELVIQKL